MSKKGVGPICGSVHFMVKWWRAAKIFLRVRYFFSPACIGVQYKSGIGSHRPLGVLPQKTTKVTLFKDIPLSIQ